MEIEGEIITSDIVNLIVPRLSETQQQILFLLLKGCGVRETAREIGITHPAVIKHRKKIARIASELLHESENVGATVAAHTNAAGNGKSEATCISGT
jgi:DNA-binding NarL/FixJ family response regulator